MDGYASHREAQDYLGFSVAGISSLIIRKKVRALKTNRKVNIYWQDLIAYRAARATCHFCLRALPTKALGPRKWCSDSCRGKAERSRWSEERRIHNRIYRKNSKWWQRPENTEIHKKRHRDWYERVGRQKLGHTRRGERWSLPERQVRDYLIKRFPGDDIRFFDRKTIGLELDVYNVTRGWAIDIRGIHHYKPIYGEEHLAKVQRNDRRKEEACPGVGIRLVVLPNLVTGRGGLLSSDYEFLDREI
jgi:hypothetical protein